MMSATTRARVLVVDDSPTVVTVITGLLTQAGYEVQSASSGEEAFEKCSHTPYDLVVSDLTMGALSGVQLCRLLKSDPATANIPVVLLTAADDPRSRFWARNAGATAYVGKEAMRQTLVAEVEEALASVGRPSAELPAWARSARGERAVAVRPNERLCRVLDDLLFDAVIASEARRLIDFAGSREAFARGILNLAMDVATYGYLMVKLVGPMGTSYTVHARDRWPAETTPEAAAALGIPDGAPVEVVRGGAAEAARSEQASSSSRSAVGRELPVVGETERFMIEVGTERLGELVAFGGAKRLVGADRRVLDLLAREIGLVAKTVFLMEQAQILAETDPLTLVSNRRQCNIALDREIERARRYGPLSVILCDIDHFKRVNDSFGHNVGDIVIKQVAQLLGRAVRGTDLVARWGGEEFLVLLPNTGAMGARAVAERIRRTVEQQPAVPSGPDRVTVTLGVATFDSDPSSGCLVDRADKAMYQAKKAGRNRVEVAQPYEGARPEPERTRSLKP